MANKKESEEIVDWEGPGLRKAGHIPPYTDEQKEEWIKCAHDPIYFIEKYWKITHPDRGLILFPLRPFQKEAITAYQKHRMIAMLCSRQVGKSLSLSTKILTPTGFKFLKDIHIGDTIYGPDGKETKVLYESPVYTDRTCYNVTFDNGEVITADAEHLWTIGTITQERIPGAYKLGSDIKKTSKIVKYKTLTTEEIIPILNKQRAKGQSVFIDVTKPLEMEKKELPINPYLLGLWIGDGYSHSGDIIGLREDVEQYEKIVSSEVFTQKSYKSDHSHMKLVKVEGLYGKLKQLNLLKNKHIPAEYLLSSFDDRLALLQGLLDTDGSITKKGSAEFYTKSEDLANQVQSLMASLGIKAKITAKIVTKVHSKDKEKSYYFEEPRRHYKVRCLTTLPVVRLKRKAERLQTALISLDSQRHYIQSIEKVETVPVKCIKVDNESHLFLAGNSLIPTHNTSVTAAFIGWFINFHPNVSVGVLADKQETAIEIHDRLKLGYENVPHWLKHGYTKWNIKSIKLENGSSVQVSATTINAGRGRSFSIVFLDEFAAVKKTVADKFKASIIPTIAAGTETKLFVTSTPQGKNHFYKIIKEAEAGNNWHLIKADYRADPARDNEKWVQTQIKELGRDMFRQEHLCLAGESRVRIKTPTGEIKQITIEELYELIGASLISSHRYLIETPSGFLPFDGIQKIHRDEYVRLTFDDGTIIRCSTNHRFETPKGLKEANKLKKGNLLQSRGGSKKILKKEIIKEGISLFDPLNVAGGHLFYSEDVISHNCDFIGSTQTLIHPDKLRSLVPENCETTIPINIYQKPKEDRQYVMICDCGEGVGLDYSSIQVIDVSEKKYGQVAAYHDNMIRPHELALLIKQVAEMYNDAMVFIEDASTGPVVSEALFSADYKNLISLEKIKGKEQFKIVLGRNNKGRFGGKTTLPVKLIGCTELKRLIENDDLIINDKETISELESFSRQGAVYAAEEGNNDDLVMALLLFGWLHTIREFKLLLNNSIVSEEGLKKKAETYQIINFMQKLNGVEQFESDGVLWTKIS
jgi:hypothetical protein